MNVPNAWYHTAIPSIYTKNKTQTPIMRRTCRTLDKKQDALKTEEEMEIVGVEVRSRPGPVLSVEALTDEKPLRLSNAPAWRL
jgi:hypothetical protein